MKIFRDLETAGFTITEKDMGWYHEIKCNSTKETFIANNLGEMRMFLSAINHLRTKLKEK